MTFGIIGQLQVTAPLVDQTLIVSAKGSGDAASILNVQNGLTLPFEYTAGNSSATISELINKLLADTEIQITSDVPLSPLVATVLETVMDDLVASVNTLLFPEDAIIYNILSLVVDPILSSLGIGIGEIIVVADQLIETCLDMDDAPNMYNTYFADNGPSHVMDNSLYLGPIVPDSDSDGHPSIYADYDTKDDGIANFDYIIDQGVYVVDVTVTNTSQDSAQLVGWIDFNNNGVFENNYERSVMSSLANVDKNYSGSVVVIWDNIPEGTLLEGRFARFRLSSDPNFFDPSLASPNGFARDGEVEDYFIEEQILPIELLSFEVKFLGENIEIEWQTTDETYLDAYYVEKSFDGTKFINVHTQHSENQSATYHDYSFIDEEKTTGTIYYRLRSQDLDGQFDYSEIKSIFRKSSFYVEIAPNPFVDILNLTIGNTTNAETTIKIYNSHHQLIYNNKFNSETKQMNYDMSEYANGIYIVTIINNNNTDSRLIFKN
ncbi:MAG: hypothetical protein ACJA1A_003164 [Saprospiraceae bacterium]